MEVILIHLWILAICMFRYFFLYVILFLCAWGVINAISAPVLFFFWREHFRSGMNQLFVSSIIELKSQLDVSGRRSVTFRTCVCVCVCLKTSTFRNSFDNKEANEVKPLVLYTVRKNDNFHSKRCSFSLPEKTYVRDIGCRKTVI